VTKTLAERAIAAFYGQPTPFISPVLPTTLESIERAKKPHDHLCRCTSCKPAPPVGTHSESLLRFYVGCLGLGFVAFGVIVGRAGGWL